MDFGRWFSAPSAGLSTSGYRRSASGAMGVGQGSTLTKRPLSRAEIRAGLILSAEPPIDRPRSRSDCIDGPRPCPWVGCRHHLYLDVVPQTGSIKLPFGLRDVSDIPETCSLDVAARGPLKLAEVGRVMNVTRERIRQLECRGLISLRRRLLDLILGRCVY